MKNTFRCVLREYMADRLFRARREMDLTQAKFAELVMMDTRSYVSLEHGENLCCTLTFIVYLVFLCKDPEGLIKDLRKVLLESIGRHEQK